MSNGCACVVDMSGTGVCVCVVDMSTLTVVQASSSNSQVRVFFIPELTMCDHVCLCVLMCDHVCDHVWAGANQALPTLQNIKY